MNIETKKYHIKTEPKGHPAIITVRNKTTKKLKVVSRNDLPSDHYLAHCSEQEFDDVCSKIVD